MTVRAYPIEMVDCDACDGLGEDLNAWPDPLGWNDTRCTSCWGRGVVEVCANCLDDFDGCSVCMPVAQT